MRRRSTCTKRASITSSASITPERKAYVKRVESDYYTDAIDYTQVKVLEEFEGEALGGARRGRTATCA